MSGWHWLILWALSGVLGTFLVVFVRSLRQLWPYVARGIPARQVLSGALYCALPHQGQEWRAYGSCVLFGPVAPLAMWYSQKR